MPRARRIDYKSLLILLREMSDTKTRIPLTWFAQKIAAVVHTIEPEITWRGRCMTELKTALNRELMIGKTAYRLTVTQQGFKLVLKGKRKGLEIAWEDLVSGDAAMAVALRASLDAPSPRPVTRQKKSGGEKANPKQLH